MKADVYWNTHKRMWSVRVDGKVYEHLPIVALGFCRMTVRERERQRCIETGQRSVHAWITGDMCPAPQVTDDFLRIGYSPWNAGTFTIGPCFTPIYFSMLVVLSKDGSAWSRQSGLRRQDTTVWRGAMRRFSRYPLDDDWRPPAKMMAAAPILEDYEVIEQGEDLHVRGIVHGSPDPRFPDGAEVTSGVVQVMDEVVGYALTYHGSWRLGARKDGGNCG